jgi:hypothetical protein
MGRHRVAGTALQPDMREIGEFLGFPRNGCIDHDSARGEAVLELVADRAEIGRTEEGDPVVRLPGQRLVAPADRGRDPAAGIGLLKAESSEARATRQLVGNRIRRHVEIVFAVDDFARLPALHDVDALRLLEEAPEVEERRGELALGDLDGLAGIRALVSRERRKIRTEADLAVGVVIDLLQNVRGRHRRRLIRSRRQGLRSRDERFPSERGGRTEL